jgi:hypothetical protein
MRALAYNYIDVFWLLVLKIYIDCLNNEGKSAARWQHGSRMFCNFYLVKNSKIAKNSMTNRARKKTA